MVPGIIPGTMITGTGHMVTIAGITIPGTAGIRGIMTHGIIVAGMDITTITAGITAPGTMTGTVLIIITGTTAGTEIPGITEEATAGITSRSPGLRPSATGTAISQRAAVPAAAA